ncbi:MAG: GLPGLI family protein [Bacteroidota bacterium]|nr:GLPGLI family protein [Bacteroidota bacterium]
MKIRVYFLAIVLLSFVTAHAQKFISKAVIEYEVKANVKKTMGSGMFEDMLKDQMPTFKTGYYNFTFANNKSIYQFDHWDEESKKIPQYWRKSEEENVWYCNYSNGTLDMQKNIGGTNINIEDSIPKMQWKITNENRVIAGFNCRKAVAIIFDSVYVFAFYTDEIVVPGGPCSIQGLPGMTLGVTIPRLYTSWIATKVMLNGVDESTIKPVSAKKHYDLKYLEATIRDSYKDWYSDDPTRNKEILEQKDRSLWQYLL